MVAPHPLPVYLLFFFSLFFFASFFFLLFLRLCEMLHNPMEIEMALSCTALASKVKVENKTNIPPRLAIGEPTSHVEKRKKGGMGWRISNTKAGSTTKGRLVRVNVCIGKRKNPRTSLLRGTRPSSEWAFPFFLSAFYVFVAWVWRGGKI